MKKKADLFDELYYYTNNYKRYVGLNCCLVYLPIIFIFLYSRILNKESDNCNMRSI